MSTEAESKQKLAPLEQQQQRQKKARKSKPNDENEGWQTGNGWPEEGQKYQH